MKLSAGTVVLIIGWGVTIFVLWNLHRHAKAFSISVFWKTAAGLTLAAVAIFGWLVIEYYRHVVTPPRVLIFPFIEKSSTTAALTPLGFGLADQLTHELQQRRTSGFYPLPTPAAFAFASCDSLISEDYAVRLARAVDLPFIGCGDYSTAGDQLLVQFRLIDLARGKPVLQSAFAIADSNRPGEAMAGLGEKLGTYFGVKKATSSANHSGSDLPTSRQNAYYSAQVQLLRRHLESAVEQATALAQLDTAQALFIALEARARMQLLRQRRAAEAEWKNALAVLIPRLQSAVRRDPLDAQLLVLLGESCLHGKKWNEAENALKRARALDPLWRASTSTWRNSTPAALRRRASAMSWNCINAPSS
jgi:tetratricopeptide (TPR) repeat protein